MRVPKDPVLPGPEALTLVVGLGNPVLGDDAVGWRVAEALRARLGQYGGASIVHGPSTAPVEIDCLSLGGLRLMERLVGYERAIVVDALVTGNRPAGSVAWEELEIRSEPSHTGSAHDTSLATALQLGRALGATLPADVRVLGIEAGPCFEFSESLSPAVAAAVPRAVDLLLEELRAGGGQGATQVSPEPGPARSIGPGGRTPTDPAGPPEGHPTMGPSALAPPPGVDTISQQ